MFSNRALPKYACSKYSLTLYIIHYKIVTVSFPTAPFDAEPPTLKAAQARLAGVLGHPAFSAERRLKAQLLLTTTSEAQQVYRWAALALLETVRWEDAVLLREESQSGPPAFPVYPY